MMEPTKANRSDNLAQQPALSQELLRTETAMLDAQEYPLETAASSSEEEEQFDSEAPPPRPTPVLLQGVTLPPPRLFMIASPGTVVRGSAYRHELSDFVLEVPSVRHDIDMRYRVEGNSHTIVPGVLTLVGETEFNINPKVDYEADDYTVHVPGTVRDRRPPVKISVAEVEVVAAMR